MRRFVLTGFALVAILSGCRKQEALTPEQEMNAIMEANSPFASAEIRMDDAMTRAAGVDAGDSWVRKMIEHHKGAIAIARQTLAMSPDAHVAAMARSTIADESHELDHLQTLVRQGTPDRRSADLYQPAVDKMHQAMMAANGSGLSQTYHLKMLEQHKGAVALSDIALANGATGSLRAVIEQARAYHLDQVRTIAAMLREEAGPAARTGSGDPEPPEPGIATKRNA